MLKLLNYIHNYFIIWHAINIPLSIFFLMKGRARAQSHANIRKKIIRPKSEDKQERSKN